MMLLLTIQGLEQQLRAVVAHEDAYHFEAQLDELSKGRQAQADLLAEMAEECAAALTEVCTMADWLKYRNIVLHSQQPCKCKTSLKKCANSPSGG